MAIETVAANGSLTGIKKGKEGLARFTFPANYMGLLAFTGEPMRAYIQDWSLDATLNYQDGTPIGEENKVEIFDTKESSGSANFNFRTGSAPLLGFINVFADVIDKGVAPAEDVVVNANPEVAISVQLFVDKKHYWEGNIQIQSANTKGASGSLTTFGVNWKFSSLRYVRLPADLVEV